MRSPTFWADSAWPLISDTSTVINLLATGCAPSIASALPNRVLVVDAIPGELEAGRLRGRKDAEGLERLAVAGHVDIVSLGDVGLQHFEALVAGPASETLGDGEAATIAYALEHDAVAVLDESKATRLCGLRFPKLQLLSTVDILLHPEVRHALGEEALSDAIFTALRDARMRVFSHHLAEVVRLIRPERAALCPSLPRIARSHQTAAPDHEP